MSAGTLLRQSPPFFFFLFFPPLNCSSENRDPRQRKIISEFAVKGKQTFQLRYVHNAYSGRKLTLNSKDLKGEYKIKHI